MYQKLSLPPWVVQDIPSVIKNGILVTESIASWVNKKFVYSPYDYPSLPKFRLNCLMAIEQHDKLRLVLNMLLPEENFFNSNITKEKLEKISMSSARSYGYSVMKAGPWAIISKFDLCHANKIVNCQLQDFWLLGFMWLYKYFYEIRQMFSTVQSTVQACCLSA